MARPPKAGDDSKIKTAERRARAVELRRRRKTFAEIGADLGVSAPRAYEIYSAALKAIPSPSVEAHRAEELALIDDAVADLLPIATDHDNARAIDAWNSIRGWAERKAKLLGLDAPIKVSAEAQGLGAEIAELIAEWTGGQEDPG